MRTLCDVCEAAPAHVFCAADEAALCPKCDEKVHDCNKLASRHLRVTLAEARAVPHCDICENAPAFFFCGIDGTSLCLTCDMNVHVDAKKTHTRYLLLGQRVELPTSKLEVDLTKQPMHEPKWVMIEKSHLKPHHTYSPAGGDNLQDSHENSNTSAIAIAVGDRDPPTLVSQFASQMIDLNSKPNQMGTDSSAASQSVRDMNLTTSNDEEAPAVVPDITSKGKSLAENWK